MGIETRLRQLEARLAPPEQLIILYYADWRGIDPPGDYADYLPAGTSGEPWGWTPNDGQFERPAGAIDVPGGWFSQYDIGGNHEQ